MLTIRLRPRQYLLRSDRRRTRDVLLDQLLDLSFRIVQLNDVGVLLLLTILAREDQSIQLVPNDQFRVLQFRQSRAAEGGKGTHFDTVWISVVSEGEGVTFDLEEGRNELGENVE